MQAYRAYYRRGRIVPVDEHVIPEGSELIITVLGTVTEDQPKQPQTKRPIGFAKGADIPDCFFEPLSEEELQAWEV